MSQAPPVGNGPPKNGITSSSSNIGNSKSSKSKANSKKDKSPDTQSTSPSQPPPASLNNATISSGRSSRSLNKFLCCFCVSRTDQDHADNAGEQNNTKKNKPNVRGMGLRGVSDKAKGYVYRPAEQHPDVQSASQSQSHCTSESGVQQLACPTHIPIQLQSNSKDDIIKSIAPAMPGVCIGPPQTAAVAAHPHYRPPSTPGPFQGLPGIPAATVGGHTGYLLQQPRLDDSSRKCVVIDLDETLVHSSFKPVNNADFIVPVEIDGQIHSVYVLKRPHVDEFLQRMGQWFECILFTASLAKYADPVSDLLDKWGVFRARLFRDACVFYKGNYVKDLGRLGRSLDRLIIVDNSPASYAFHPEHAVAVTSWFDDMSDTELHDLLPLFESLYNAENIFSVLASYQEQRQLRQQLTGGGAQQTVQQLQAASAEQAAQLGVPLTVPITSPPPAPALVPAAASTPAPAPTAPPIPTIPPPEVNLNLHVNVIHSIAPPDKPPPSPPPAPSAAAGPEPASTWPALESPSPSGRVSIGGRRPSTPPESFGEPTRETASEESAGGERDQAISEKFPFSPPPVLSVVPLSQTPAGTPPTARGSTSLLLSAGVTRTGNSTPISGSRSSSMAMIHSQARRLESCEVSPAGTGNLATRQERASLYTQSAGGSIARNSFDSSVTLSSSLRHNTPPEKEKRSSSPSANNSGVPASARQGASTLPLFLPNPNARRADASTSATTFNSLAQAHSQPSPTETPSSRAFKQSSLRSTLGKSAPPSGVSTLGKEHAHPSPLEPSSAYRSASQNCLSLSYGYGAGGVGSGAPAALAPGAGGAQAGVKLLLHGGSSSALNSNRVNLPSAPDSHFIRNSSGSSASSASGAKFPGKRSTAASPPLGAAASAHS